MVFLVAVALVAAGLADPLVESVANAGTFGSGYHDDDHLSVIPALFAGVALFGAMAFRSAWRSLVRSDRARSDWALGFAIDVSRDASARDLPLLFVLQFGALLAMEGCERLVAGSPSGSLALWFGGPIAFSIAAHVAIGTLAFFMARAALGGAVEAFRALISFVRDAVIANARPIRARPSRRDWLEIRRAQEPHVRSLGGRAPPHRATPSIRF